MNIIKLIVGIVIVGQCAWVWAGGSPEAATSRMCLLSSVGKAAADAGMQSLNAQAKAVIGEAKKTADTKQQGSFVVKKAKAFMGSKDYDTALQLAHYVLANVDAQSADAKKLSTDAMAALEKCAQDKISQLDKDGSAKKLSSDVRSTASGIKGVIGAFGAARSQ